MAEKDSIEILFGAGLDNTEVLKKLDEIQKKIESLSVKQASIKLNIDTSSFSDLSSKLTQIQTSIDQIGKSKVFKTLYSDLSNLISSISEIEKKMSKGLSSKALDSQFAKLYEYVSDLKDMFKDISFKFDASALISAFADLEKKVIKKISFKPLEQELNKIISLVNTLQQELSSISVSIDLKGFSKLSSTISATVDNSINDINKLSQNIELLKAILKEPILPQVQPQIIQDEVRSRKAKGRLGENNITSDIKQQQDFINSLREFVDKVNAIDFTPFIDKVTELKTVLSKVIDKIDFKMPLTDADLEKAVNNIDLLKTKYEELANSLKTIKKYSDTELLSELVANIENIKTKFDKILTAKSIGKSKDKGLFGGVADELLNNFNTLLTNVLSNISNIKTSFDNLFKTLKIDTQLEALQNLDNVLSILKQTINNIHSDVVNLFNSFENGIKDLSSALDNAGLDNKLQDISSLLDKLSKFDFSKLTDNFKAFSESIDKLFVLEEQLVGSKTSKSKKASTPIDNVIMSITTLVDKIDDLKSSIDSILKLLNDKAKSKTEDKKEKKDDNRLLECCSKLVENTAKIHNILSKFIGGNTVADIISAINDVASKVGKIKIEYLKESGMGLNLFQQLKNFIASVMTEGINVDYTKDLASVIKQAVTYLKANNSTFNNLIAQFQKQGGYGLALAALTDDPTIVSIYEMMSRKHKKYNAQKMAANKQSVIDKIVESDFRVMDDFLTNYFAGAEDVMVKVGATLSTIYPNPRDYSRFKELYSKLYSWFQKGSPEFKENILNLIMEAYLKDADSLNNIIKSGILNRIPELKNVMKEKDYGFISDVLRNYIKNNAGQLKTNPNVILPNIIKLANDLAGVTNLSLHTILSDAFSILANERVFDTSKQAPLLSMLNQLASKKIKLDMSSVKYKIDDLEKIRRTLMSDDLVSKFLEDNQITYFSSLLKKLGLEEYLAILNDHKKYGFKTKRELSQIMFSATREQLITALNDYINTLSKLQKGLYDLTNPKDVEEFIKYKLYYERESLINLEKQYYNKSNLFKNAINKLKRTTIQPSDEQIDATAFLTALGLRQPKARDTIDYSRINREELINKFIRSASFDSLENVIKELDFSIFNEMVAKLTTDNLKNLLSNILRLLGTKREFVDNRLAEKLITSLTAYIEREGLKDIDFINSLRVDMSRIFSDVAREKREARTEELIKFLDNIGAMLGILEKGVKITDYSIFSENTDAYKSVLGEHFDLIMANKDYSKFKTEFYTFMGDQMLINLVRTLQATSLGDIPFIKTFEQERIKDERYKKEIKDLLAKVVYVYGDKIKNLYAETLKYKNIGDIKGISDVYTLEDMVNYIKYSVLFNNKTTTDVAKQLIDLNRFTLEEIENAFNKAELSKDRLDFLGRPVSGVSRVISRLASVFGRVSYYYTSLYLMDYLRQFLNEALFSQVRMYDYEKEIQKYISPGEPYQALKPLTSTVSLKYGVSRDEVWNSYIEFAKQGKTIAETIQLTEGAILGLNVAAVDYKGIVTYLTTATNIWKNEFSSVIPLIDKLAYVQASTAASSEVLIEAMKRSGSVAKTFGVSLDLLQGYIAAISEKTLLSGEVIGTSLKTIIERSQRMKTIRLLMSLEPFKEFNFIDISKGKILDAANILSIVAEKWNTLTDVQKKLVGEQIAGNRQLNAFIALMEGMPRVNEIVAGSLESVGYAMKANGVELEKLSKAWTRLKVSVGSLFEGIGQALASLSAKGLNLLSDILTNKTFTSLFSLATSTIASFLSAYVVLDKVIQTIIYSVTILKSKISFLTLTGGIGLSALFSSWNSLLVLVGALGFAVTSLAYTYSSVFKSMDEKQLVLNNKLKETIKLFETIETKIAKFGSSAFTSLDEINKKLGKLFTLEELKEIGVPVRIKEGRIEPDINEKNYRQFLESFQEKLIKSGEEIPRKYNIEQALDTLESAFTFGFEKAGRSIDKYKDVVKAIFLLRDALMPYHILEKIKELENIIEDTSDKLRNLTEASADYEELSRNYLSTISYAQEKLNKLKSTRKLDVIETIDTIATKNKLSKDVADIAKFIYSKLGEESKKLRSLKPFDFDFIDKQDLEKVTAIFESLFSVYKYRKGTSIIDLAKQEYDDLINSLKYVDEFIDIQYKMALDRTTIRKLGTDEFIAKLIVINNEMNRLKNELANLKLESQVGSTIGAEIDTYRERIDKAEKSLEAFTFRYRQMINDFTVYEKLSFYIQGIISKLTDYKTAEFWAKLLEILNKINPKLKDTFDATIDFNTFVSKVDSSINILNRFKMLLDDINNTRYKVFLDFVLDITGISGIIGGYKEDLIDKAFKHFTENLDLAKNVYNKINPELREKVASYIKSHLNTNLEDIKKALGPIDLRRPDIIKYLEMLGKSEKELEYFDAKKESKETSYAIKEAIRKAEADFQHLQTLRQHWQQMLPNKYLLKYDAETQKLKEELNVKDSLLKQYESQLSESDKLKLKEDISVLKHKIELQEKYRYLAQEIANFEEYQTVNKINLETYKTTLDLTRELIDLRYQAILDPTLSQEIDNLKLKTNLRLQELYYERQIKYEEKYRIALNAGFNDIEAQRLALRSEELQLLDIQIKKEQSMLDVAIRRAMLERYKKAQTETQQIRDTFSSTLVNILSNKEALEKQKQILELMIKLENLRLEGEQASYGVALAESVGDVSKINEAREKWNSVAKNVDETRRQMEELNKTTSKWAELLTNIGDNILKKIVDKFSDFIFKSTGLEDMLTNFFGRLSEFRIGKKRGAEPIAGMLGLTQIAMPMMPRAIGLSISGGFANVLASQNIMSPMIGGAFGVPYSSVMPTISVAQPSIPQPFSLFGRNNSAMSKYFGPALLGYAIGSAVSSPVVGALGGGLSGWLIGGITGGIIGAIAGFLGARRRSQPTPEPPPPMREFYPLFKNTEALDRNTSALLKLNDNIFNPPQVFEMPKATIERYNAPNINITINATSNNPQQIANSVVKAIETAYSSISKRIAK